MKLEARDEGSAATSRTDKMRGRSKYLCFLFCFFRKRFRSLQKEQILKINREHNDWERLNRNAVFKDKCIFSLFLVFKARIFFFKPPHRKAEQQHRPYHSII